jgi:hypothetical protein
VIPVVPSAGGASQGLDLPPSPQLQSGGGGQKLTAPALAYQAVDLLHEILGQEHVGTTARHLSPPIL